MREQRTFQIGRILDCEDEHVEAAGQIYPKGTYTVEGEPTEE